MRKIAILMLVGFALAGCNEAGITCPTLKTYSPEFLKAASAELKAAEATSPHLAKLLDDYGVERDAIRKCLKLRK